MSTKLLSIAIPTYNMSTYLCRCLDSVTQDDVPDTLELIVVNDGSTDNSLSIMQEYAKKRPDIVNIIDKTNGHYGSCINAALKVATGKYFRILDADDWLDTEQLIQFLKNAEAIDVNLIITPRTEHRQDRFVTYSMKDMSNNILPKEAFDKIPYDNLIHLLSMHSMTYSLPFLRSLKLRLQEGICYTDTEFYLLPLEHIKNFIYLPQNLYQYQLNRDGQSMDFEVFKKNRHQFFIVLKRILEEKASSVDTITQKRIQSLLETYYGMLLFEIPLTPSDQEDMLVLRNKIRDFTVKHWEQLNKKLFYTPYLWEKTGTNMFFYTKIKKLLGISRIFFREKQ
jgi:glycosyltransferase involved in cell wall biosynthesis